MIFYNNLLKFKLCPSQILHFGYSEELCGRWWYFSRQPLKQTIVLKMSLTHYRCHKVENFLLACHYFSSKKNCKISFWIGRNHYDLWIFLNSNPLHQANDTDEWIQQRNDIYPWHQFFWLVTPPLKWTFILVHLLL